MLGHGPEHDLRMRAQVENLRQRYSRHDEQEVMRKAQVERALEGERQPGFFSRLLSRLLRRRREGE